MSAVYSTGLTEGAQGAYTGFKMGGGWGALIGAIVGGGTGIAMGFQIEKGRSYQKQAGQINQLIAAMQQDREKEAYRQSLLTEMRKDRIQRASTLAAAVAAGVEEGSSAQGTLSSIGSSISNVIQYMANDRARVEQMELLSRYANYMNEKAMKKYKRATNIKTMMDPLGASGNNASSLFSKDYVPKDDYYSKTYQTGQKTGSELGEWYGSSFKGG